MPKSKTVVYCVDPGSVAGENFGRARQSLDRYGDTVTGADIHSLVFRVADDLKKGRSIALGFECVLFIPLRDTPASLTRARTGERNRPWSAGAGATLLPTGLAQVAFILRSLRSRFSGSSFVACTKFSDFDRSDGRCRLLLWEAFVSDKSKGTSHQADAAIGVSALIDHYPDICVPSNCAGARVFSLIGAVILRTGWNTNLDLLSDACVFVRA